MRYLFDTRATQKRWASSPAGGAEGSLLPFIGQQTSILRKSPNNSFYFLSLMKRIHRDFLPEQAKIVTGKRGGQYYLNEEGQKVYITTSTRQPQRSFKAKRGAFLRWLESQSEVN